MASYSNAGDLSGLEAGGDANPPRRPPPDDAVIHQLNSLLRGEISAAETYRMAIDQITDDDQAHGTSIGLLREMQEEHGRAAQALRDRIREVGGEPSDSSGVWGVWAKVTQATSDLLGDEPALRSLREGEQHGLEDYREALEQLDVNTMELVQNQLIPAQQRHINLLDQLISTAGRA